MINRSRPGRGSRPTRVLPRAGGGGGGGGGGGEFFGSLSMYREFWAEDPDWTNPGDGNNIVTARCNGSLGIAAVQQGSSTAVTYQASGINSKPCFEFHDGRCLFASGGSIAGSVSVVAVAQVDDATSRQNYIVSHGGSSSQYRMIDAPSATDWRAFDAPNLNVTGGTRDTNPHLFVAEFEADNARLWVDDTLIGTDSSGAITIAATTFQIGGPNGGNTLYVLNGRIPYAAVYAGAITQEAGYQDFVDALMSYYALS